MNKNFCVKVKSKFASKLMTTVNQMKCACESCLCIVSLSEAITKDGKAYCSEACANHHPNGDGCGHADCNCHA